MVRLLEAGICAIAIRWMIVGVEIVGQGTEDRRVEVRLLELGRSGSD